LGGTRIAPVVHHWMRAEDLAVELPADRSVQQVGHLSAFASAKLYGKATLAHQSSLQSYSYLHLDALS